MGTSAEKNKNLTKKVNDYLRENPELKNAMKVFSMTKNDYKRAIQAKSQQEGKISSTSTGRY